MENVLSTKEASEKLQVSVRRVQALISSGKLPARKVGRDFVILESDLARVGERKCGRPPKRANGSKVKTEKPAEKPFKTAFDIAPRLMRRLCGKHSSGINDLSSNKKHLEELGKKSAEKEGLLKRG
jgi:excisionase family DNA binding protein